MGKFFDALTDKRGGKPEPLLETTCVLAYEVGNLIEQAMFMKWADTRGDEASLKAHRGFYKSELMDTIAQTVLICQSLGLDFEEWKQDGEEKAMERFTGKEKRL